MYAALNYSKANTQTNSLRNSRQLLKKQIDVCQFSIFLFKSDRANNIMYDATSSRNEYLIKI